jgi:hypothetical protein
VGRGGLFSCSWSVRLLRDCPRASLDDESRVRTLLGRLGLPPRATSSSSLTMATRRSTHSLQIQTPGPAINL